jgi:hypothetical protein
MKKVLLIVIIAAVLYYLWKMYGMDGGSNSAVTAWAQAIQQFEGWFPGSRSYRNNNPGNLRVLGAPGQIGVDPGGFAIFDSYASGFAALVSDLTAKIAKYPGATLAEIMGRYAPASDGNDTSSYTNFIARALGVSPDTKLSQLGG